MGQRKLGTESAVFANTKQPGKTPTFYDEAIAWRIINELSAGRTLTSICRDEGMPNRTTFLDWCRKYPWLKDQYDEARIELCQFWADQIVDISDDNLMDWKKDPKTGRDVPNWDNVARARLRIETRKWLMERVVPHLYGNKVFAELTGKNGAELQPIINISIQDEQAKLPSKESEPVTIDVTPQAGLSLPEPSE